MIILTGLASWLPNSVIPSARLRSTDLRLQLLWHGHQLSVSSWFPRIAAWIQTQFCGKLPIHHISRPLFSFFLLNLQLSNFYFSVFVTWEPIRGKNSKGYFSHSESSLGSFGALCKISNVKVQCQGHWACC